MVDQLRIVRLRWLLDLYYWPISIQIVLQYFHINSARASCVDDVFPEDIIVIDKLSNTPC